MVLATGVSGNECAGQRQGDEPEEAGECAGEVLPLAAEAHAGVSGEAGVLGGGAEEA